MGKIGVMADKETSIYFRLGGIKNTWVVNSQEEAGKTFDEIKSKQLVSLVIVTDPVFDWIKDRLGKGKKEIELPLVVSIPTRKAGGKPQIDLLADLIKRTVGVEIRVQ
jgi:V/A-type H+/Na+-transporting ATPase subunit F